MEDQDTNQTPDALERKERSIARLKSEGVLTIDHLPSIIGEAHTARRSVEEIAERAMALMVVAAKGEGIKQSVLDDAIERYDLAGAFSPREQNFLLDPSPSDHDMTQFLWRYEAAWVLFWALGYVETLGRPTDCGKYPAAIDNLLKRTRTEFIADAALRPLAEILDEADLIYRYHWAIVNARLTWVEKPPGLDADVTMERHYAINWLVDELGTEWDEISTDT